MLGLAVALQAVPYGHDHANPKTTADAPWSTPAARSLAVSACYDCHSNRTNWRWYSFVAPVSWVVQNHVQEGRDRLNFSEWDRRQRLDDVDESIREGSMPPSYYRLVHAGARLSASEKAELIRAVEALPRPGR